MNNIQDILYKTELTAADYALYWGQTCQVVDGYTAFNQVIGADTIDVMVKTQAMPLLRPLSSMTEEEYMEFQFAVDRLGVGFYPTKHGQIVVEMLSRGFDIFKWIDAKLAIDKSEIEQRKFKNIDE